MMKWCRLSIVWLCVLFCLQAQAWTVFTLNGDRGLRSETDIFVIGYAGGVGSQFVATALTRAYKILEREPNRSMIFLWANDRSAYEDRMVVQDIPGVRILESNEHGLTLNRVIQELERRRNITSLHFVGHSSALYGFGIQEGVRFQADARRISGISRNFANGAYVFLHGCNTAFHSAPELSRIWGIPVFGSLTSTDFQQLHNNGDWYWNNRGQFPAQGGWKRSNDQSFAQTKDCRNMACHRLKPNNHPYGGGWGRYEIGLPFYKAFCNFNQRTSRQERRCAEGVWNAFLDWPSTTNIPTRRFFANNSAQTFEEIVEDFLCPKLNGRTIDRDCRQVLDTYRRTRQVSTSRFFFGAQPECTMQSCSVSTTTGNSNLGGSRTTLFTGVDSGNLTLIREYQMYENLFRRFGL